MSDLDGTEQQPSDEQLRVALEQSDNLIREHRVARLRWLCHYPSPAGVVVWDHIDTAHIMQEARDCFLNGHYIATVLLATAFIEHILADLFSDKKLDEPRTLEAAIHAARQHGLLPTSLLDNADALRRIRNPFTHRKPPGHVDSFQTRFVKLGTHPDSILEEDAKHAFAVMDGVFRYIIAHPSQMPSAT